MDDDVFDGIVEGMEAAIAYQKGDATGAAAHVVEGPAPVDIKALRARFGMTQTAFSAAFRLNLQTVRQWENGRRIPRGPDRLYLRVIEREPEAVRRALAD